MIGVSGEVYGNAAQAVESWAKPYDFAGVPEGFTVAAKAKLDETGTAAFPDAATCRDAGRPYDGTNDRWVMDTFIYSDNVECLDCSTVDLGLRLLRPQPRRHDLQAAIAFAPFALQ